MASKIRTSESNSSVLPLLKETHSLSKKKLERRTTVSGKVIFGDYINDIDISHTDFENCEINKTTFIDCDLRGVSFNKSQLSHVRFQNCLIYDMDMPEVHNSIVFVDCIESPCGVTKNPETIHEKIIKLIEEAAKASKDIPTEKLQLLTFMIMLVTIIIIVVKV